MRIGIDCRFYGGKMQGLGRYAEQLIINLAKIDVTNIYVIFVGRDAVINDLPKNFHIVRTTIHWYGIAEQLVWPIMLFGYRLDLMHFIHFNVPLLYNRPFIVTIHDLILKHYHSTHVSTRHPLLFKLKYFAYEITLRHAVNRSKVILTMSDYSRKDILTYFPHIRNIQNKIHVTFAGVTHPEIDDDAQKIDFDHSSVTPYFLYVGNSYPHKNLTFLIEAFEAWNKDESRYNLVLVGKIDEFYQKLINMCDIQSIKNVYFTGAINDLTLALLYSNAEAFVFPSLYEGIGLPPLEAMSYGTPVIASNASCIPEILGDAAIYIDPLDQKSLRHAFTDISTNESLRNKLISKGYVRIRKYSWDLMAKKIHSLYELSKN